MPSLDTSTIRRRAELTRSQVASLRYARLELKQEIFNSRVQTDLVRGRLYAVPRCPICNKAVPEPSMHEWLITRGDIVNAPFEEQLKIYVPVNVILLHERGCHQLAQNTQAGKLLCLKDILCYHSIHELLDWLSSLDFYIRAEAYRYVTENS